jgi:hypothetical protein
VMYIYRLLLPWCGSVLLACGRFPHHPPRGDGCPDVEASRKMDVAAGACSSCGGLWLRGRSCYGQGCVDWQAEVVDLC